MPKSRSFFFGTNFKMHQTVEESIRFYNDLGKQMTPPDNCQLFLLPPLTSLAAVTALPKRATNPVWVGAQNMHWEAEGAYTGEVSARMLGALGVDLVLIGHAERRGLFHEGDVDLNKKVRAAMEAGLRVLLCVGETAEERDFSVGPETIARQLKIDLHGLEAASAALLLIAYEPVWSIGEGGLPATPHDVAPIAALIRTTLHDLFGAPADAVPLLYGGSVNPGNAASFAGISTIDGLFVGRAAWTVDGFVATLEAALAARPREQ